MDVRLVLLIVVIAIVAAVRWRRRAPEDREGSADSADSADSARSAEGRLDDPRRSPPTPLPSARRPPARRASAPAEEGDEHVDVELEEALDRVWHEHARDAGVLLDTRLRQLVDRGVPVRALRPAPGGRAIRVAFADGTVLLSRGSGQGDFGRLGLALLSQSVRLGGYSRSDSGVTLEFRWNPDHRLAAVAVGLDQPD